MCCGTGKNSADRIARLIQVLQSHASKGRHAINILSVSNGTIYFIALILISFCSLSFDGKAKDNNGLKNSFRFPFQRDSTIGFSTYFGGGSVDEVTSVAVDGAGNIFIAGNTGSANFPVKSAFQNKKKGGILDGFVAKVNASGSLVFSTYFGGSRYDEIRAATLDNQGHFYVAGTTESKDFPLTEAAFQTSRSGPFAKVFVAKFNPNGSLVYSTYLGGTGSEAAFGIAVNKLGEAFVTGATNSSDFPTKNHIRPYSGDLDAFITKLNPSGSGLIYSTYLGGSDEDISNDIDLDPSGNAYVTGSTRSSTFPKKRNLFPFHPGFKDVFIAKVNGAGMLVYSVFYGGTQVDVANAIAVSKAGNVYVGGYTMSRDLPTKNALQAEFGGGETKAFLGKINFQGNGLIFSTYFGGDGLNAIRSIVLDMSANVYISGASSTSNLILVNPIQSGNRGGADAFVAKLTPFGRTLRFSSYLGGGQSELSNAISVDSTNRIYVVGNTLSPNNFPLMSPLQNRYGGGIGDGFITRIENIP